VETKTNAAIHNRCMVAIVAWRVRAQNESLRDICGMADIGR
jgi:hypothetical protein